MILLFEENGRDRPSEVATYSHARTEVSPDDILQIVVGSVKKMIPHAAADVVGVLRSNRFRPRLAAFDEQSGDGQDNGIAVIGVSCEEFRKEPIEREPPGPGRPAKPKTEEAKPKRPRGRPKKK